MRTGTEKQGKQQAWHPTWAHHSSRKGFGSWGTWGPKHEPLPCQYEQGRLRWYRGGVLVTLFILSTCPGILAPRALALWPYVPLHADPSF